jgi:hypothetical protein
MKIGLNINKFQFRAIPENAKRFLIVADLFNYNQERMISYEEARHFVTSFGCNYIEADSESRFNI